MATLFGLEMPGRDATADAWAEWMAATVPQDTLDDVVAILSRRPAFAGGLKDVCDWWNGLRERGLVSHGVRAENPSKELRAAWSVFLTSETAQECLADLDKAASEIEAASFVRGGWFRLEKLLRGACNGGGVPICRVLIDGGYRDDKSRKQADDPRGNRSASDEYLKRFGDG